jgi:hypothetical protein
MIKFLYIFCFISFTFSLLSQERWQQWIDYKINVDLDVETNILNGKEIIKYYNNSPDTLKEIYCHLYWNAFKPGSYMNIKSINVNRDNGIRISLLRPDEQGNVKVNDIKVNGINVRAEEYGTILKIILNNPLYPKDSIEIYLDFISQVPKLTRRSGRDNNQGIRYSMAQWYPKVCEYDFEGWHHDQYAGREFYGVWGNFDVMITLDANYVIGATGIVQNPEEVKCGYEFGRIDTTWIKKPSEVFPKGVTKTWHFKALNVHDFAWVADDKYIHDIIFWKDVIIHSFYIPSYRDQWRNVKYYAQDMLDFYSENYGMYPYRQFTIAQAGDAGMEYPNITFNASGSPGLVGHEGGHQWFYGLVANNESREAWLDEGFITYITNRFLIEKFRSPTSFTPAGLSNILLPPYDLHGNYRNYWQIAKLGIEEPVLTHSDYFEDDMIYSFETYAKGGMILPMIEYVIGDSVFNQMMKTYFEKWHFKHPHSQDFQRIAEKESGMELDWFFDEWLTTTKTCDYAINKLDGKWITEDGKPKYQLRCELENKDKIIMPIDLMLMFKGGKKQKMIIPVEWGFKKEENTIILPRWDWVNKKYSFTYSFDEEVMSAEIDPSLRLKDLNRLNNTSGFFPKFDIFFIRPIQLNPPVDAYWIQYKPHLLYSIPDGIKPGIVVSGGYLGGNFIPPDYATRLGLWYCTKSNQMDFDIGYSSSISGFGKMAYFSSSFSKINGVRNISIEINKLLEPFHPAFSDEEVAGIRFEHTQLIENDYPQYHLDWERGKLNTLRLFYNQRAYRTGLSRFNVSAEVGFNSTVNYSKFIIEIMNKILNEPVINLRFYGGFSSSLPPVQNQFNLTSSNANEQYKSFLFRNLLGLNKNFPEKVNLRLEGEGNLRGYIDRYTEFNGRNILAFNLETGLFSPLKTLKVPFISGINLGLFFDAGNIWSKSFENTEAYFKNFRFDGGLLLEYSLPENLSSQQIKTVFSFLNDFIIRFNIPFWVSHPESGKNKFDWRWNISIGKAITF